MKKLMITKKWLVKHNACRDAVHWFNEQTKTDPIKMVNIAMSEGHFDWVNWALVRKMNRRQKVQYAVFAAELVIDVYEKKYNDTCPRKAIEAAKKYINKQSVKNKDSAYAAVDSAYSAANAANANAAYSAADSAYSAANAAYSAANAAYSAYAAAAAAAAAANAADYAVKKQIIDYGISLLV